MRRTSDTGTTIDALRAEDLRRQLMELAQERFREQLVDTFEIEHLVEIATNYSLLLSDVYEPGKIERILKRNDPASRWIDHLNLPDKEPHSSTILHLRNLPDQVKTIADKCLYDVGVFQKDEYRGVSLTDLGMQAYRMASEILEVLAEDSRLRDYFRGNTLGKMPIEDEVVFLRQCAQRFTVHADLLHQLGLLKSSPSGPRPIAVVSPEIAPKAPLAGKASSTAVRTEPSSETALESPPAVPLEKKSDDRCVPDRSLVPPDGQATTPQPEQISGFERLLVFSALPLDSLRSRLKEVVIDQEEALDTLCDEFTLYATGTQNPRRPSSYLFVGPTGVGKNYLVESLVQQLEEHWGNEVPLLLLEGPNFTYPSDINELRGATRGFIRSDEEGVLTQFHHRSSCAPFAVLIVDEVEKAHPQLCRFFLSLMDRGTVTDNRGQTLRFSNTLVVFTSNLGYSRMQQESAPIGFESLRGARRYPRREIERELKKTLSPEFLNRLTTVHFAPLSRTSIAHIFDLEFAKITSAYESIHDLKLVVTARAKDALIERGYSSDYGARYLASTLQRHCNIEVSKKLKRDESNPKRQVQPVLEYLREVRSGQRLYRPTEAARLVNTQARVRVPYHTLRIDFRRGKFRYESEGHRR